MTKHGLGTITSRSKDVLSPPESPVADINVAIGLSKDEYDELNNAMKKVLGLIQYTKLFNTVKRNLEDLINTIGSYLQAFIRKDANFLSRRDISLNINKDLLNVLASFRFYLDYMDNHLKNDFDQTLGLPNKFQNYCSEEYDKNFSYRLIYHLRYFAQHKGFVVGSISFQSNASQENRLQINYALEINIHRNDLLEDKSFKKELKTELEKLPAKIQVIEHFREWIKSLTKIHTQISEDLLPTVLDDAKMIKNYLTRLTYDEKDERIVPAIFTIDRADENSKKIFHLSHIPLPVRESQQIIEHLEKPASIV